MRMIISLLIGAMMFASIACSASCATNTTVRDKNAYALDVAYHQDMETRAGATILRRASSLPPAECQADAELGLVLLHRSSYHADMSRYLGGLTDKQPGDPPMIPNVNTICTTTISMRKRVTNSNNDWKLAAVGWEGAAQ